MYNWYTVKFKEEIETEKGPKLSKMKYWMVQGLDTVDADMKFREIFIKKYGRTFETFGTTKSNIEECVPLSQESRIAD